MTDENKFNYIFGPVNSRRLGSSLGLDMIPFKTCSLDCAYCECGKTTVHEMHAPFIPGNELIDEIGRYLAGDHPKIDVITFAGSGEPLMNDDLPMVLEHINKNYPDIKTAILTNSTHLHIPKYQDWVMGFDYLLPSFDAILQSSFEKINRPAKDVTIDNMIKGLIETTHRFNGPVWLELFIVPDVNDSDEELALFKEFFQKLRLDRVQINTLDRPGAYKWVNAAPVETLKRVAEKLLPLPVEIVSRKHTPEEKCNDIENINRDQIITSVHRRPMTIEDIAILSETSINTAEKVVSELLAEKKIKKRILDNQIFYK